jgi:hypothetical protein
MKITILLKKTAGKILRCLLSIIGIARESHSLSGLCLSLKKTKDPYTVLQIGANDGERHDPLKLIIARDKPNCWLVEPVPEYFESLYARYAWT